MAVILALWASGVPVPKQDLAVEIYHSGTWHDLVSADEVFVDAPVTIRRGLGDESGGWPRPATISARLDNATDKYRTSNPESELYGLAGRNTPMRVSVGGTVRGIVEASSWTADQTDNFRRTPRRGRAWVDVTGGGLLQRTGQRGEPLKSAFRQYNESLTHISGYWPGEQAKGSTDLVSLVSGTGRKTFKSIAPDSQYRPPGSAPLLDFGQTDDAELGAYPIQGSSATAGFQASWAGRYETLLAAADGGSDIFDWATTDGTQWGLYLNYPSTGDVNVVGLDAAGTTIVDATTSAYAAYDWSQWTLLSIDFQYSGGTTDVWVNWVNAGGTDSGFLHTSYAGEPSVLDWWDMSVFAGVPKGSTVGHVQTADVSSAGGVNLFDADRKAAWYGYLGETAAVRFARLCDLLGIAYYVSASYAASMPMGPQPVASFPEHVKEIVQTEDALVYDVFDELRIQFWCRVDRYRRTPTLTLYPADLPALPKEVNDDKIAGNVITVSQRGGGDYIARDDTGPNGTQAPPDGVGEEPRTVNVNLAYPDENGAQVANWWLRRSTVNLPRYPQVLINLAALDAARIADIEAVDVGHVIEISGFRENVIRLQVLGWTETIGTHSRSIVFNCVPDLQFQAGFWDSTASNWDSSSTTLKTAVGPNDTALTFRTATPGDLWSTNTPYSAFIAGEQVTVTSMGAASLVSGAYDQAATVTRHANGITKPLGAGEPIHVTPSGEWDL